MKKRTPKPRLSRDQEFRYLENQLKLSLKPVAPRADFVLGLKKQLNNQFDKLPSFSQISRSNIMLMTITLLVCALLIIFFSIRAALTLISAFSLLYQYHRQGREGKAQQINPGN